jgi:hypothetical protein
MGVKLRSITKPIHWSLLLKPIAVAAAWLILPWWGFLVVAIYCYFVPFFRVSALSGPFLIFLFLSLVTPPGFPQAIYAAMILILIFGIKDLVIVNRKIAYEFLAFLLSFAGCLLLFYRFGTWALPFSFAALVFGSLLWLWLVRGAPERQAMSSVVPPVAALVFFEIGAVIFVLPLSFFAQGALLFFGSALLFEFVTNAASFTKKQFLAWSGIYAVLAFLSVLLVPWKI